MEANKEQQKPLPAESAPSIHGHTIEDPTAEKIWSDVDPAPPPGISRVI
jgi:hypothetical protein